VRMSDLTRSIQTLILTAGLAWSVPALAQSADASSQPDGEARRLQLQQSEQLSDFIHFVRIARFDIAQGVGQELVRANIQPRDFTALVEESRDGVSRFEETMARAMRVAEVEATAGALLRLYEQGKLSRARDPQQVEEAIKLLDGTTRNRDFARQRLMAAGEFAMPLLLKALIDNTNPVRAAQVASLLGEMGRQSIIPLVTALPKMTPEHQERVLNTLSQIPYRTSLPFIYDLRDVTANATVREACARAADAIERGSLASQMTAADHYVQLAEGYYARKSELTSFPGEDDQLLWSYDPGAGLIMTPIRTAVFYEAMAMRMTERALTLKSDNPEAVALWVASNFSREIRQTAGYDNPAYPPSRREAMYYAVAAGAASSQRVLARAVDGRDTQLARKAIAAIERTAGGSGLWSGQGERRPLLEALTYPNRRVQYEAALAIASAQPGETFAGSDRVVPILSGAIREASLKIAAAVAPDAESYQRIRRVLEADGFTVLPMSRTLAELSGPVAESPSVDVLVMAGQDVAGLPEAVQGVRNDPKLSAAPVLILTTPDGYTELRRRYERDTTVTVRQSSVTDDMLSKSITELVKGASGGVITGDEARLYAGRCLAALRDLAVSNNATLSAADSALPLIGALSDKALAESGTVNRLEVAEVLSRINQERCQSAIMDAALNASGPERVAFLGRVADSAKRFGNLLSRVHVSRTVELAQSADRAEATAAAALLGALNLSNADLVPLIVGDAGTTN
jgi:hypothetical protein